jgi:hypothetical protein
MDLVNKNVDKKQKSLKKSEICLAIYMQQIDLEGNSSIKLMNNVCSKTTSKVSFGQTCFCQIIFAFRKRTHRYTE